MKKTRKKNNSYSPKESNCTRGGLDALFGDKNVTKVKSVLNKFLPQKKKEKGSGLTLLLLITFSTRPQKLVTSRI